MREGIIITNQLSIFLRRNFLSFRCALPFVLRSTAQKVAFKETAEDLIYQRG